jgi:hypothetical protein
MSSLSSSGLLVAGGGGWWCVKSKLFDEIEVKND